MDENYFKVNSGPIYYSPKYNAVFQRRLVLDDYSECSGFAMYPSDTRTTLDIQQLSNTFIENECVPVWAFDTCEFLETETFMGNTLWKVKQ